MNCNFCGKSANRVHCGKCKIVSYCNTDCQRSDWLVHKLYCKEPNEGETLNNQIKRRVIIVSGSNVREVSLPSNVIDDTWKLCEVPSMIGVPVKYRIVDCPNICI